MLSDAFENKTREADVELKVRMLNINHGHNEKLMEKCKTLKEYAEFVDISRRFLAKQPERNTALNQAIDYCIDHGILSEFLRTYRAEVLGMLLEEFDAKKYEKTIREEGKEEGRIEGRKEREEQMNHLVSILLEQNRIGDLKRSTQDSEYRKLLFEELHI